MKKEFKVVGHGVITDFSLVDKAGLDLLNHSGLNADPMFKSLKTDLERYYSDVRKPKEPESADPKERLHSALYTNLHSLLSELTYTKDQSMQKQMLHTIHNWYIKKTPAKPKLPSIQYHHSHEKPGKDPEKPSKPRNSESNTIDSSENQSSYIHRSQSPYLPKRYQSADLNLSAQVSENIDKRYLELRKKDLLAKKEAESKEKVIAKWGMEKSRATSDHTQKTEQTKLAAYKRPESPQIIQMRHAQYTTFPVKDGRRYDFTTSNNAAVQSEPTRMTPDIHKINKLRKLHASLLDIEDEFQTPKKRKNESSMSIYKHHESFDVGMNGRAKSSDKVSEQYGEVLLAKSKLASKNVACPINYLIDGLILPQDRIGSPDVLPRGGEYLINNPLLKLGRKKKKKGKKKGKKKKKT